MCGRRLFGAGPAACRGPGGVGGLPWGLPACLFLESRSRGSAFLDIGHQGCVGGSLGGPASLQHEPTVGLARVGSQQPPPERGCWLRAVPSCGLCPGLVRGLLLCICLQMPAVSGVPLGGPASHLPLRRLRRRAPHWCTEVLGVPLGGTRSPSFGRDLRAWVSQLGRKAATSGGAAGQA